MTISSLLRGNAGLLTLGLALSLCATATTLLLPALVSQLLSSVSEGNFYKSLTPLLLTLLATSVFTASTTYVTSIAADRAVRDMRKKITDHLLYLKMSEFEKRGAGSFTSRITSDTSIVSTAFSSTVIDFVGGFTVIIGSLVYMAVVDWKLLLVVIVVLLIALVIIVLVSSSLRSLSSRVQDHLAALGDILQSALSAFRTIKAFRSESKVARDISVEIDHAYRHRRKMSFVEAVLEPLSTVASYLALVTVALVGSIRLNNGDLSAETLTIFVTALFLMLAPVAQVTQSFGTLFEAKGALERIDDLFSLDIENRDEDGFTRSRDVSVEGTVEFESVSYVRNGQTILNSVSAAIKRGEKVALSGVSGSGKTTLFGLILRFYDPSAGNIRVGGRSLKDWCMRDLRKTITYVEQEPDLLPTSLRNNLILGTNNAPSDDTLITLLEQFGLDKFASSDGLDRPVGYDNSGLSGGERQRVAIIRAILQDSSVVLVDEPTSALDTSSAELAMERLLNIDATVIFTSHDRNVIKRADRVLRLADGKLVEHVSANEKAIKE
ncbi:ABC transporter ATP-binding protein [Corynebacterium sp.]|uniref:ABC transporter ATP-binding protein n=1 Tax=Corynebacterium sp. TaxID=1720 RepID=UPI0026DBDED5|nr:ABC transporter ATP-binding protein [Corynebacterium sp.]MDO4914542.1 ABC transporter ATP-binding protein [Corynebacterium sp.]